MSSKGKHGIASLFVNTAGNNAKNVPPVLIDVGKLAAGVATVGSTSSATGNPRNKCALPPGHSLMDWIRLGNSGKDLTGVGDQAGRLAVTLDELSRHNKLSDAWLAIRGTVYNVTAYLPFHPGGPEELMRGVGKDATKLFDDIHPWVNYQSILQKCCVGRLVAQTTSAQAEKLFDQSAGIIGNNFLKPTSTASPPDPKLENNKNSENNDGESLPKFDWLQKLNDITCIFHTAPMSNPLIEVRKNTENSNVIKVSCSNSTVVNEINFYNETVWPPSAIDVNYESGKLSLVFKKVRGEVWDTFGVLKQELQVDTIQETSLDYIVAEKTQVARNVFNVKLKSEDGFLLIVPIGFHVRIFGDRISRSYTPIPNIKRVKNQNDHYQLLNLLVKRYEDGNVSRIICDSSPGDTLSVSKPIFSGFNLDKIEKSVTFLMLAAGTGVTPMISLMLFLLERRLRRCQWLRMVFCNKSEEDIPFKDELDELEEKDSRFHCEHLLSEPNGNWGGKTGHITSEIIEDCTNSSNVFRSKDSLYIFVCGPVGFNRSCASLLSKLEIDKDQIHVFQG